MVAEPRALAPHTPEPTHELTAEQIDLIKKQIAVGATDAELQLFLYHCKRLGLDPMARQIYWIKRGSGDKARASIQTGIDGYRLIADRTGLYAGNDDAVFVEGAGHPESATVTVWKWSGGQRCPFTATARWIEYCPPPGQDQMWTRMPHTMLAKCGEALALRKAFPQELAGLYTDAEMDQAVESTATEVAPKPLSAPLRQLLAAIVTQAMRNAGSSKDDAVDAVRVLVDEEYDLDEPGKLTLEQARELLARLKAQEPKPEPSE
jgi:phage recombination protein Bet